MPPRTTTDRREQIVDAALALVREGGLGAASVRATAARAGLGASTLRYYFPTQSELNQAVAARLMAVQFDDHRIHDRDVDPVERLIECLAQFLPAADDEIAQLVGWLDLVHGAVTQGEDSLHAQLFAGFARVTRERVTAWLTQLASEGHLAHDEVERAVTDLLVRIDGLSLAILDPGAPLDLRDAHAMLARDVGRLLER